MLRRFIGLFQTYSSSSSSRRQWGAVLVSSADVRIGLERCCSRTKGAIISSWTESIWIHLNWILFVLRHTERRYAGAVYAVVVCVRLSVCPPQAVCSAAASDDIKVFWCRPIMLERWTCDVVTERSQVWSPVFPLSANNLQSRLFANRVVAMQTVNLVVLRSYRSRGSDVLRGWEGNRSSVIALAI